MKPIPHTTKVRWAVHPSDQGRLAYIDGLWDGNTVPYANDVITRPFLVDPVTRQPVPVRVVEIVEMDLEGTLTLAVVVTREH